MNKEIYNQFFVECNSMTEKKCSSYQLFLENKKNIAIIRQTKKRAKGATDAEKWLIENYEKIIEISKGIDILNVSTTNRTLFLVDCFIKEPQIKLNKDNIYTFFELLVRISPPTTKRITCMLDIFYLRTIGSIAQACLGKEERLPQLINRIYEIAALDFENIISHFSPLEKKLRSEKNGIYISMTRETQKLYQRKLLSEARIKRMSVEKLCDEKLKKAELEGKHFGFFLAKRRKQHLYYPLLLLFYLYLLFDFVYAVREPVLVLFLSLPLFYFCKGIFDFITSRSVTSEILPSMKVDSVKNENKTVAVITSLIASDQDIEKLCARLKRFQLNNRTKTDEIYFGLLCDFPESKTETSLEDFPLKQKLSIEIDKLNKEVPCFFAVVRNRVFHKCENKYVGWERKRGAIESFVHWLHTGNLSSDMELFGIIDPLKGAEYLITLDGDTQLGIGQAKELIGIASHPLNKPVVDVIKNRPRVVSGYGIIQPKMTTSLLNPIKTPFGKVIGNGSGEIFYSGASFDFMQSLYHEGNFCGKGIIHVPSYDHVLFKRFPEQKILSHDMPEGAFLRCGLATDIFFSDSEPQDAHSFYKRQHRWIRGDVQNLFLFFELPFLRKLILLENICRYLVPIFEFSLLFSSSFFGIEYSAICFFLIILFHFRNAVESFCDFLLQRNFQIFHRRFFTKMRNLILNSFYKSIISASSIAFEGYYFTDAIVRALYRMIISKKKLLEWQVYSPFSNKKDSMLFYLPSLILTCGYLTFCKTFFSIIFGILWLSYPIIAIKMSMPYKQKTGWGSQEQKKLYQYAEKEFSFFKAAVSEKTNFLPPDNIQILPYEKIAMRTSPTNIGMYLMSLISAKDFGIIDDKEYVQKVVQTIDTVEKLEHFNGHLFNWYDIEELTVIGDRFVSTVDSGNFIASLICLHSALKELKDNDGTVKKIICKIEKEIKCADFRSLYDYEKKLFYVGIHPDKKQKTASHYDLYVSEARITAFMCIALGQVAPDAWFALLRPILSFNGNVGIGSWSGTTFEYFMPTLFLPVISNSLDDETLEYAYYCQKRFGAYHPVGGTVFGISESGYSLTDDYDNYQYKAFGVPYLSTQSENSFSKVISPYSSFLMLEREKKDVLDNLSVLEDMGLVGEFGFYEACEFNSNFIDDYVIISSYMAHHKGMTMVALANAAFKKKFVKRFLNYDGFVAKSELLAERFPIEGKVYKKKKTACIRSSQHFSYKKHVEKIENERSKGKIYSDGKITLIAYSDGGNKILFNEKELVDSSFRGIVCEIRTPHKVYSFFDNDLKTLIQFSEKNYELQLKKDKVSITLRVEILGGKSAVLFCAEVNGISESFCAVFFVPVVLQKIVEFVAHPAFQALSLEGKSDGNTLTIRRRGVENHQYLHFLSSEEFRTEFKERDAEKSFDYRPLLSSEIKIIFSRKSGNNSLIPLVMQFSEQEKVQKIQDFCDNKGNPIQEISQKTVRSIERFNEICQYDKECFQLESKLLVMALRDPLYYRVSKMETIHQNDLWKFGISGDFPIVTLMIKEEKNWCKTAETFLRVFKKMRISGISFDLVFLKQEKNEYFDTVRDNFTNILVKNKCEFLLGKHPGIHFISVKKPDELKMFYVISRLAFNFDSDFSARLPAIVKKEVVNKEKWEKDCQAADHVGIIENYGFSIDKKAFCPSVPFSHVISNRTTGFVCNQNSLGFTWHRNAGLKRISKWINCPSEDDGEKIYLRFENKLFDLIQSARFVNYRRHFVVYEGKILDFDYKIVATVSEKLSSKIIFLFLDERIAKQCEFIFSFIPVCGQRSDKNIIISEFHDAFCFQSVPIGEYKGGAFLFCKDKKTTLSQDGERMEITISADQENALFFGGYSCEKHLRSIIEFIKKCSFKEILQAESLRFDHCFLKNESDEDFWIRYQSVHSRYFGRTGLYQSSGAYGFRDQLQDCLVFLDTNPEITKQQILRAASHQYIEGDVQHWWHPNRMSMDGDAGIRSRCSDDYLWLIYACDQYIRSTGDADILNIKAPYICGETLKDGQNEVYHVAKIAKSASIREHLLKCCELFISRGLGKHQLPFIGCGDWNDGMNKLKGESVWLGFFGAICLNRVKNYFPEKINTEISNFLEKLSNGLKNAYNGSWFIRVFCDDGKVFGNDISLENECSIDLITQAFAAFYQMEFFGTKFAMEDSMIISALKSAFENLVDEKNHTCALFQKPFVNTDPTPGYIQRYVAGVRENGGQYTHAAVWFAMALLLYGKKQENSVLISMAKRVEKILSPFKRIKTGKYFRYRREPYVLCGDVYTAKSLKGHGGWSWYTGAAGWYLKLKKELEKYEKEGC